MDSAKKPSIFNDRSGIGSIDELDEYGVWVKSEPEDLALDDDAEALSGENGAFDIDIGEEALPEFDFAADMPLVDAPTKAVQTPSNETDALSTELLLKIANELSTIKKELNSLKNEVSTIRNEKSDGESDLFAQTSAFDAKSQTAEPDSSESEASSKKTLSGFFDDDDPDETIALTGDELNKVMNAASGVAPAGEDAFDLAFGSPALADDFALPAATETKAAESEALSDNELDAVLSNADIMETSGENDALLSGNAIDASLSENAGLDDSLATNSENASDETASDENESFDDIDFSILDGGNAETTDSGDDIDLSTLTDESAGAGDDIDLSMLTDESAGAGDDIDLSMLTDESAGAGDDIDLSMLTDENAGAGDDIDLSMPTTDESAGASDDIDLSMLTDENAGASDETLAEEEAAPDAGNDIDLGAFDLDMPDDSLAETAGEQTDLNDFSVELDEGGAETSPGAFDDFLNSELSGDIPAENEQEMEIPVDESAPTIVEVSADTPDDSEAMGLGGSEALSGNELDAILSNADITDETVPAKDPLIGISDAVASSIVEDKPVPAVKAPVPAAKMPEPAAKMPVPAAKKPVAAAPQAQAQEPQTQAPQAQNEGEAPVSGAFKKELQVVLSYMDQLLEALPDKKIEEFARSDQFEIYKKVFKDLGLM